MTEDNDITNALLDRWLAGELDDQDRQRLHVMAENDAELAALLKGTVETRDALDTLSTQGVPQVLTERLMALPDLHPRRTTWWRSLAAAAVVSAVVAGGGTWFAVDRYQQQLAEVQQAREDMAVAMYYLQKTTNRMRTGVRRQVQEHLSEMPRKTLQTMGSELRVLPLGGDAMKPGASGDA